MEWVNEVESQEVRSEEGATRSFEQRNDPVEHFHRIALPLC